MKEYIEERALAVAGYIIESNATVRQAARQFGISKSTVHKDITERLMQVNPALAKEARKVLDINKSERHIRGGHRASTARLPESRILNLTALTAAVPTVPRGSDPAPAGSPLRGFCLKAAACVPAAPRFSLQSSLWQEFGKH